MKKKTELAVYKGDNLICIGTAEECADHMGVLKATVQYYLTPSYQTKLAKRKNPRNYITVERLEDDE